MHREQPDFTIVPLTKEHFDLLNEQGFLDLLSGLDIQSQTQPFTKISNTISQQAFSENIEALIAILQKMRNEEGKFDKQTLQDDQIELTGGLEEENENEDGQDTKRDSKKFKKHKKDKKKKKNKKHREEEDLNEE